MSVGGSVELIACNNERMLLGKSLKLGAIRLADRFSKKRSAHQIHDQANGGIDHERSAVCVQAFEGEIVSIRRGDFRDGGQSWLRSFTLNGPNVL